MLTAAMDAAGDPLSSLSLTRFKSCVLNTTFKTLVAFIQCFKVAAALLPSDLFTFLCFSATLPVCIMGSQLPGILSITQTSNVKRFPPELETEGSCHRSK